jgi:hypothetical protein
MGEVTVGADAGAALREVEYGEEATVLVFADTEAALERCRRTAEARRCRVGGAAPLAEAAARLDRQVGVDSVLIEVEGPGAAAFAELAPKLVAAADCGRYRGVVVAPGPLAADILPPHPSTRIHWLFGATGFETMLALSDSVRRTEPRLRDIKGPVAPRLQQLSEEAARIAATLSELAEEEAVAPPPGADGRVPVDAALVRAIIRARRLRDQYFRSALFADPAWDMLLDLFAARLERRPVAVSSLCIASAVPSTTALRWIRTLTDQGVFVRLSDPTDGRRVFIELSDKSAAGMKGYLEAVQRISPVIV